MCIRPPDSVLCCPLPLIFVYFLRSDEAGDEAIGHVFGSVLRDLVLLDEDNGVGAGVATWHPLGKVPDLVSTGVCPSCPCGLVCDEVAIFQEFSIVSEC